MGITFISSGVMKLQLHYFLLFPFASPDGNISYIVFISIRNKDKRRGWGELRQK